MKSNFFVIFSQLYILKFSGEIILLFLEGLIIENIYFDCLTYDELMNNYDIVEIITRSLSSLSVNSRKEEVKTFIHLSASIFNYLITYEVKNILELRRDTKGSLLLNKVLNTIQQQINNSEESKSTFRPITIRLFADLVIKLKEFILCHFFTNNISCNWGFFVQICF